MSHFALTHESGLLLTLEEISQLVSHSHHPGETLANIVRLIQRRFHTDVCSVYLLEPDHGELVLGATVGLKVTGIGQVRMRLDEGLTGLVAEQMAPVMVDDAFAHPRFKYFPEAGEDPYHSFLGVPLVEGGTLQGVLVVQTVEPRTFSPNEIRLLIAVAAQLAPLVSEAHVLEQVEAVAHELGPTPPPVAAAAETLPLPGTPLSPGIGRGEAYLVNGYEDRPRVWEQPNPDPAEERTRLAGALEAAREEISRLSQRISTLVGEDHGAILQGQLMILQDGTIADDLAGCLAAGCTAEGALRETLDKYVEAFQKLTNPFFQERVYDVKDVFRRVLWHLRPHGSTTDPAGQRVVLVAQEASVMDLFSIDLDRLAGVVVEHGGPQSHAAILARSLGIPMVGQVHDLVSRVQPGRPLRVDGTAGRVEVDPPPESWASSSAMAEAAARPDEGSAGPVLAAGLPRLETNINLLCEVMPAVQQGTCGVGLYRTEFLFLARRTLPTEDEQERVYRKLLTLLQGRPASIRTFDLRPDKLAHTPVSAAAGHSLDWRLVLESPPIQQLFKDQVRAILRAAVAGPARILVPLVTRTEQLDFVLETVAEARQELLCEGLEFDASVPVGIMLEVAAATAMVETWAGRVDYFALGTNDLVSSALGIDRDDPIGARDSDALHPGVLRMIQGVVTAAHQAQRGVAVCGEMATDPEGGLALAALAIDSLSVAVPQLGTVRQRLARQSPARLKALALELLRLASAAQVREFLQRHTEPGDS
jgi:phosphotransferase system enzyme I (PtsP)